MGSLKTLPEVLTGCNADVPSGRPVLEVRDVELSFGGVRALRGVSFDVAHDELFAIIGPRPTRSRVRASRGCSRTSRCSTRSRCSTT